MIEGGPASPSIRAASSSRIPSAPLAPVQRVRALGWFFLAVLYTLFAREMASRLAQPLAAHLDPTLADSVRLLLTLLLLLAGYAGMGFVGQLQRTPLRDMGLAPRPGAVGEWGLGAALGWAGVLACVVPTALFGQLILQVHSTASSWASWLGIAGFLALSSLAEEVAFRGYPFQRLIDATGPVTATVVVSALFATAHLGNPGASGATWCSTFLAGALLSMAYLRTRALWLGWGFHFAWNASTALLFGLPLSGLTDYSPVFSSYTRGPVWLTGGGYGPEGSAVVLPVLLALLIVLARATVELKQRWATPAIIPGGYPVDVDALARAQHTRASGLTVAPPSATAGQTLVQIAPAPSPQEPAAPAEQPPTPTDL